MAGKSVVVTGGASGIGAACARRLAAEGASGIVIGDVDEAGAAVAAELGAAFVRTDVSRAEDCHALVETAVNRHGRVDVVVAAAGISHGSYLADGSSPNPKTPLVDVDPADWRRVLDVNLDGVFHVTQAAARHMIEAGTRGSIVTVASMNAQRTSPGTGPYSVSKAAAWMLTKSFAIELAPHGIRANAVAPGFIETPMTDRLFADPAAHERALAGTPLGRLGVPDDVAHAVLYLAGDEAAFVTGTLLYTDGGYLAAER